MSVLSSARGANINGCNSALDEGADINERDPSGKTGVYLAAEGGCTATYMNLANRGADVNIVCNKGGTALHGAAIAHPNADYNVGIMLWYGADVDAKDRKGRTPLHWVAMETTHEGTAKGLLDEGADVNAVDDDGWTPLDHLLHRIAQPVPQWGWRVVGPEVYNKLKDMLVSRGGLALHEHAAAPQPAAANERDSNTNDDWEDTDEEEGEEEEWYDVEEDKEEEVAEESEADVAEDHNS